MKKLTRGRDNSKARIFLTLLFFSSIICKGAVAIWTGDVSGDWNTAANWSGGVLPSDGDDITVNPSNYTGGLYSPTVTGNSLFNPNNVTVQNAAVLTIDSDLKVYYKVTVTGTSSQINMSAGEVNIGPDETVAGTKNLNINTNAVFNLSGGTVTVYLDADVNTGAALNISGSASFSTTADMRIINKGTASSSVTMSDGTVDIAGTLTLSGGTSCSVSPSLTVSGGTMSITGILYWTQSSSGFCASLVHTTPVLTVSGGTLILKSGTRRSTLGNTSIKINIQLSSGTLEIRSAFGMTESIDILNQTGGTLLFSTGAVNWTNGGSYSASAGTAEYNSAVTLSAGTAAGTWQFYDVTIGASGGVTLSGNNISVSGDWDNSAAGAFTPGTRRVTFNSSTEKQIISSGGRNFYAITTNNSYATIPQIQFNSNVTATSNITMTNGKVDLNGFTLTLGSSAVSVGTLTYASGWLYGGTFKRWMHASAVIAIGVATGHFPMGARDGAGTQNKYRPLWISQSTAGTGGTISVTHSAVFPTTYTVASHNDASWGFTLQGVSESTWNVTVGDGYARPSDMGIRFGGEGFGTNVLTDLNASFLAGVIGTHSAASGSGTIPYVNRTLMSSADITSGDWRLGTKDVAQSPLPIELLSFDAFMIDGHVQTHWITVSEINNDYFTVERSIDGINFEKVAMHDGAGISTEKIYYTLIDSSPIAGRSYYRLKQTDFNGDFSYSEMVAVNSENTSPQFTVFPNPVSISENLTIKLLSCAANEEILVIMIDNLGREVYSKINLIENAGEHIMTLDNLYSISPGVYQVIASSKQSIVKQTVVVK